jgi:hypothetical protein
LNENYERKTTLTKMMTITSHQAVLLLLLVCGAASQEYLDRFTYEETSIPRGDSGYFDYAPQDWNLIDCPVDDPDDCLAYIDKWETGRNWTLEMEDDVCLHCPADDPDGTLTSSGCEKHHQSPINLKREYGLEPGTHPNANECIGK